MELRDEQPPLPPRTPPFSVKIPVAYEDEHLDLIELAPEEAYRQKVLRYRDYLGTFFVKPLRDPVMREILAKRFVPGAYLQSLYIPGSSDNLLLKQVVQAYVLSFGVKKAWKWYTTASLIQGHFDKAANMADLDDYEILVIIHTGSEVQHSYNLDLTQQVTGYRALNRKYTLFICSSESTVSKGMKAENPFPIDVAAPAVRRQAISGESGSPEAGVRPEPLEAPEEPEYPEGAPAEPQEKPRKTPPRKPDMSSL